MITISVSFCLSSYFYFCFMLILLSLCWWTETFWCKISRSPPSFLLITLCLSCPIRRTRKPFVRSFRNSFIHSWMNLGILAKRIPIFESNFFLLKGFFRKKCSAIYLNADLKMLMNKDKIKYPKNLIFWFQFTEGESSLSF